jgi:hypothetical protein
LPVLSAIMPSNQHQIEKAIDMVANKGKRKVGILGFAFKAGTDDLRESPIVDVIERLIGKGYELKLYDKNVNLAALTGANRDYILNHIPHISRLMVGSMQEVMDFAETIVIGNGAEEFKPVPTSLKPGQSVVDLVRISKEKERRVLRRNLLVSVFIDRPLVGGLCKGALKLNRDCPLGDLAFVQGSPDFRPAALHGLFGTDFAATASTNGMPVKSLRFFI